MRDIPLLHPSDPMIALGLLTRLPVRVDPKLAKSRGAQAAWAFPLVGLVIGTLCALTATIALWLTLPAALVAALALATGIILTGALHEDGLADTADGFWGAWERARRLEIMKDSHIGTYGTLALILSLLIRWSALTALISSGQLWLACMIAPLLSRLAMIALMTTLPNARTSGLSQSTGRPTGQTLALAASVCIALTLLIAPTQLFFLLAILIATTAICAAIAMSKINGQTGDVLGATQQICEIALLLTLVARLS